MSSFVSWLVDLPTNCEENSDSELAGYFSPLWQQIIEFFCTLLICAYFIPYYWQRFDAEDTQVTTTKNGWKWTNSSQAPFNQPQKSRRYSSPFLDRALVVVVILSFILVIIHKIQEERLGFLLQPCHTMHFLLLVQVVAHSLGYEYFTFILFNLYCHLYIGPILGLVASDTSYYQQFLELENWFIQHVLLICMPFYFVYYHKIPLISSRSLFWLSYFLFMTFHFQILLPGCFLSKLNLNFMSCPPNDLLRFFGRYYRIVTTIAGVAMIYGPRYIALQTWADWHGAQMITYEEWSSVIQKNNKSSKQRNPEKTTHLHSQKVDRNDSEEEKQRNESDVNHELDSTTSHDTYNDITNSRKRRSKKD